MKDRLLKLIKHFGLTATRLAEEIHVQRSGISHILSGRNQPGYEFIVRILTRYPDISPDWLLMGKGAMLRSVRPDIPSVKPDLFSSLKDKSTDKTGTGNETKTMNDELIKIQNVTNVTSFEQIVIFYADGRCKRYFPV
jgi:transcriptional regulator with XRE-family HTH domain